MWNLGTTNSDRPLVPGPAPSGRASTKWTMLSVRSFSAEVMNRLTPVMFQVPSAFWTALVRPAPTSEPASGSVRTIVAVHFWSTMSLASFFCSSLPRMCSSLAKEKLDAIMPTAGLAPRISSLTAQRSDGGTTVPPSSAGTSTAQKPESR